MEPSLRSIRQTAPLDHRDPKPIGLLAARDTRTVTLTQAGEQMRQALMPTLERIDRTVAKVRNDQARRHVSVTTR